MQRNAVVTVQDETVDEMEAGLADSDTDSSDKPPLVLKRTNNVQE
jgi:hypothetical protein